MKKIATIVLLILLSASIVLVSIPSCNNDESDPDSSTVKTSSVKALSYSVINTFPHDTSSFTEGLLFYKGELFESTGLKGRSRIVKTDLKTGKTLQKVDLAAEFFGEGIVIVNDTIYQLTYQEKVGFMYSLKDFKKIGQFSFASDEGWGMTTDGKQIIASDGTGTLSFYEPGTFKLLRTQVVTENGDLLFNLNELEFIDGFIYANQWQTPYILKIDPSNGYVVAKADLSQITNRIKSNYPYAEFLNGIAYDSTTKKIYVTGKHWPELYEIQLGQ